jgi:hypothetical protein
MTQRQSLPPADIIVTPDLVHALLNEQQPDFATLPIRLAEQGWDNYMFHLGDDLAVRMPRRLSTAVLVENEQRWLPELARGLIRLRLDGVTAGQPRHSPSAACTRRSTTRGDVSALLVHTAAAPGRGTQTMAAEAPDGRPRPAQCRRAKAALARRSAKRVGGRAIGRGLLTV